MTPLHAISSLDFPTFMTTWKGLTASTPLVVAGHEPRRQDGACLHDSSPSLHYVCIPEYTQAFERDCMSGGEKY